MRDPVSDKQRLEHILQSISEIENIVSGITFEEYMNNNILRLALIRLVEIIGEASIHLSEEIKTEFNEIEWSTLKGVRNIVVHEYFGIDYSIIWNAIQNSLPHLKKNILHMLNTKFPN